VIEIREHASSDPRMLSQRGHEVLEARQTAVLVRKPPTKRLTFILQVVWSMTFSCSEMDGVETIRKVRALARTCESLPSLRVCACRISTLLALCSPTGSECNARKTVQRTTARSVEGSVSSNRDNGRQRRKNRCSEVY